MSSPNSRASARAAAGLERRDRHSPSSERVTSIPRRPPGRLRSGRQYIDDLPALPARPGGTIVPQVPSGGPVIPPRPSSASADRRYTNVEDIRRAASSPALPLDVRVALNAFLSGDSTVIRTNLAPVPSIIRTSDLSNRGYQRGSGVETPSATSVAQEHQSIGARSAVSSINDSVSSSHSTNRSRRPPQHDPSPTGTVVATPAPNRGGVPRPVNIPPPSGYQPTSVGRTSLSRQSQASPHQSRAASLRSQSHPEQPSHSSHPAISVAPQRTPSRRSRGQASIDPPAVERRTTQLHAADAAPPPHATPPQACRELGDAAIDDLASLLRRHNLIPGQHTPVMPDIAEDVVDPQEYDATSPPDVPPSSYPPEFTSRQHLDIPPLNRTIFGEDYQTSPVMLQKGDVVYWAYSGDLLRPVEIREVTPPGLIRRQPIYSVKLFDSNGAPASHDCRHGDLFIPTDIAGLLDPTGRLKVNLVRPIIGDGVDIDNLANASDSDILRWSMMNMEHVKSKDLMSAMDTLAIPDDSLTGITHVFDCLRIFLRAAHRKGFDVLPTLSSLDPSMTLRLAMLPPPSYSKYGIALSYYEAIGGILKIYWQKPSFVAKAPTARQVIAPYLHSAMKDGWEILDHLLHQRLPFLGGQGFNVNDTINTILATDGMLFTTFISLAQKADTNIHVSGLPPPKNELLKRFLSQCMRCANLQAIIQQPYHDLVTFMRRSGNSTTFTEASLASTIQMLQDGNPPLRLSLISDDGSAPDVKRAAPPLRKYNRPIFSAMAIDSADNNDDSSSPDAGPTNDDDDGTTTDSLPAGDFGDLEVFAQEFVAPALASLSIDDDQASALILSAIDQFKNTRRPRQLCEACQGNHPTDRCRARGPAFQPRYIRKGVEQCNAKYGTEPKVPLSADEERPTPRGAAFPGTGRRLSAMELGTPSFANFTPSYHAIEAPSNPPGQVTIDSTNSVASSFPSTASECAPCPDSPSVHPSDAAVADTFVVSNEDDFNTVLSKLGQSLDEDIARSHLSTQPQLAAVHFEGDLEPSSFPSSSTPKSSASRDKETPLSVSDYAIHGEQVNC